MNMLSVLVLGAVMSASPAVQFLASLAGIGESVHKDKVAPLLDPSSGLEVDVAGEGSRVQRLEKLDSRSAQEDFERVLGPIFSSGVLKATPSCTREPSGYQCTLMTSTSLPRVFILSEIEGRLYLRKILWADQEDDNDDDDDLPM